MFYSHYQSAEHISIPYKHYSINLKFTGEIELNKIRNNYLPRKRYELNIYDKFIHTNTAIDMNWYLDRTLTLRKKGFSWISPYGFISEYPFNINCIKRKGLSRTFRLLSQL